ncbi:MAG: hypothetical protein RLZZ31_1395 [Actinomycetota bacterium]
MPRPQSRRQRQLAREQARAAKAVATQRRKRVTQIVAAVVVVAIVASIFGALLAGRSGSQSSTSTSVPDRSTTTSSLPSNGVEPQAAAVGATLNSATCPSPEGTSPRTTSFPGFANGVPQCIDPNYFHIATFSTSVGELVIQLNPKVSPKSVNTFTVLARYHYFDGQPVTKIVDRASFTIGTLFQTTNNFGFTIDPEFPGAGTIFTPGFLSITPRSPAELTVATFEKAADNNQAVNPLGVMLSGDDVLTAVNAAASESGEPTKQITIRSVSVRQSSPLPK